MSSINTDKINIYLPIEIKVREFHGKILFALVAAEAGFRVIIGGQKALRNQLHTFPPGIYMDKSVAVSKERWFERFHRLGNRIVAWDEEGLVIHEHQYLKSRFSQKAFDLVDFFFAWGNFQKDIIIDKLPGEKDKVLLAGNPRFDMLRPELKGFYAKSATLLNEEHGPIILVNTNFGFYNHLKGVKEARRLFMNSSSHTNEEFIDDWIVFQEELFKHFVDVIPWLSETFSDHTIIIRPHPSEDEVRWHSLAATAPNVKVLKSGNVLEWIAASDVVIHSNCTTGIEAYLLGVPSVAYRPVLSEIYETYLPNAMSSCVYTSKEFQTLMEDILSNGHSQNYIHNEGIQKIAANYISNTDEMLSSDFIVERLKKIDFTTGESVLAKIILRNYQKIEDKLRIIKEYVSGAFLTYQKADIYDKQKFPGIDDREIQDIVKRFQTVTNKFENIQVNKTKGACFVIEHSTIR